MWRKLQGSAPTNAKHTDALEIGTCRASPHTKSASNHEIQLRLFLSKQGGRFLHCSEPDPQLCLATKNQFTPFAPRLTAVSNHATVSVSNKLVAHKWITTTQTGKLPSCFFPADYRHKTELLYSHESQRSELFSRNAAAKCPERTNWARKWTTHCKKLNKRFEMEQFLEPGSPRLDCSLNQRTSEWSLACPISILRW